MADDTLNNILNILQSTQNNETATNHSSNNNFNNSNNDLQNLLIKLLLSGGLNNLFNQKQPEPEQSSPPRTINLENYKRLD